VTGTDATTSASNFSESQQCRRGVIRANEDTPQ
jgi:hypothetical protein